MRFKEFHKLNEATNPFNVPLRNSEDVNDYETNYDKKSLIKLVNYLNDLGLDQIPIAGSANGDALKIRSASSKKDEIISWIKTNLPDMKKVEFGQGSIGSGGETKISENTQELMVAALVINRVKSASLSELDAIKIIDEAKNSFNKIIGSDARPELLEQFNGNFNDLATAISTSNAILEICKNPVKVYWTGKGWHSDIVMYNPPIGGVKDYNSSDIVIKDKSGIFYGISLKKKAKVDSLDPTLINKPITGEEGILKQILGPSTVEKIEKNKTLFFDSIISKHYKIDASKLSDKEKREKIKDISQTQMSTYLKNTDNIFFKTTYEILDEYAEDFTKSFIELLFRTKLSQLEESGEFKFYLITGIGDFTKKTVNVEKALVQSMTDTISVLTNIFNSDLKMLPTPGKKQAWEEGATAAKIFMTIFSDETPIINLEIRYKGNYTANPQFQAVATANFKHIFKDLS